MENLYHSPVLISLPTSHLAVDALSDNYMRNSVHQENSNSEELSTSQQELVLTPNIIKSRNVSERRSSTTTTKSLQTKQVPPNSIIKTPNLNINQENARENQENLDPRVVEKRAAKKVSSQNRYPKSVYPNNQISKRDTRLYSHQGFAESVPRPKKVRKQCVEDFLLVTKRKTDYGTLVTGQVLEDSLEIKNQSDQDIWVQIEIDCFNQDLQETEEYVYSIRRDYAQDYNDRHYLFMAAGSAACFKMAIKVPLIKSNVEIIGETRIMVQGLPGMYKIPMCCTAILPKIVCPKELYCQQLKQNIVRLAIKAAGRKQESKMPLKNYSNIPITLEFGFYTPKETSLNQKHLCLVYPNCITLPPNGMVVLTILVKGSQLEVDEKIKTINQVLVGKIVDSSVFYSFPLSIDLY